ncbi:hypothetical protein HAX54_048925 [Datura stramonium]|uniref:Uncharacterized protein n=1 Tax=Datura stramonium TaxID=4076 RepID=A0ABS8WLY7_DATST|nr:hypothetical protein [Datura stramonium]
MLVVGGVGGKVDGQEDVSRGLNGAIDSTIPTKKATPNAQKRKEAQKKKAKFEAAQIASHHDKDPQNFGKEVASDLITSDVQTPVRNLNTSGSKDFDADEYKQIILKDDTESDSEEEPRNTAYDAHAMRLLQAFGATTSQMSDAQVKEFTDRQGLSSRRASHFSPGSGTGPPATRTRLRVKTLHPHD